MFQEAGKEARALGCLSWMIMKTFELVWKYGQRVKALIQKLTIEIALSMQVEWYVVGFLEEMGFQIRQARPATLREAMEAAQNYKNSVQSLWKSLKRSEMKGVKHYRKDRIRRKHSEFDNSSDNSESDTATSNSESSESDLGTGSRNRNRGRSNFQDRKGKSIIKVKTEEDESRKMMKNIQELLEAIKVNLADNQKPKKIVSTSRANVWCPRCRESSHYANECIRPAQRRIHYVNPEEEVYYTILEEEEDEVVAFVFQVHSTYRRGKVPQQPMKMNIMPRPILTRPSQGMTSQPRYPNRPHGYCFNCESPDHYANVCPFERQG